MRECTVVAEIGGTHLGDMSRAKMLISLAHLSGADYVKFQKRNPEECVPRELWDKPHPNAAYAYGNTYLEHRKNLELTLEQHRELKQFAESLGCKYGCSVFDLTSAEEIISLEPDYIKIPSCCNLNFKLMDRVFATCTDVHISLGMLEPEEASEVEKYIISKGSRRRLVYHCTSEYPCSFDRLYLKEITRYKETFGPFVRIGFSNHGKGIATDIAAYVLGAEWIERHFVDDRTLRHTDASASLEPQGLYKLTRDLKAVHKSMCQKSRMSEEEWEQRRRLRND